MTHYAHSLKYEPLIVLFSTGKDSVAMLDLLAKHHTGEMRVFFLYFMTVLPSRERILRWYENHYGITIERIPPQETRSIQQGKKIKLGDIEKQLRAETDISYVTLGVRRNESMARRGMLAKIAEGVDQRNLKFYPVADMTAKEVKAYCQVNKLPLPVEYGYGLKHEISAPDSELLLWVKHNMPDDYRALVEAWPEAEAMTKRAAWYGRESA